MSEETLQSKLKRLADELADSVYPLTFQFPKVEQYALADQIRRSVLSVPSNLYEGLARESDRERTRFINIAYGSLAELKYQLYFSAKQKYIEEKKYLEIKENTGRLSQLLYKFGKKLSAEDGKPLLQRFKLFET